MKPLFKKLYQVLRKVGVQRNNIQTETNYKNDLGFESIDMVWLVNSIEFKFNIKINDTDIPKLRTVGNTIDYLQNNA